MKILVAVDGSKPSLKAVQLLVEHCDWYRSAPGVELVTVHLPVPRLPRMGAAVGKDQIERYYKEEGEAMLAKARPTHLAGVRERFLRHFSEDELKQLATYWERVKPGAAGET